MVIPNTLKGIPTWIRKWNNHIFEMAPMPFPSNGILVVVGNLPQIFPMSSLIYARFLIPLFNFYLFLLGMDQLCVSTNLESILFCVKCFICCNCNKIVMCQKEKK